MRPIIIGDPENLPAKWTVVYNKRMSDLDLQVTHELRATYFKKYPSWTSLKSWLSSISDQKCWYCESKSNRSAFDVDHYRPKLGVTIDGKKLADGFGYYWMAYDWRNFRLSCQRCNRPENSSEGALRGKWNEFPLRDEAMRCTTSGGSLATEEPRLLDPCVEADCNFLAHGIDGEVKPSAATGTWEYERALYTIERLGFNEWNTPENRRHLWQPLSLLIKLAGNAENPDISLLLSRHLSDKQEYSRFFRAAIGSHRDKAWVDALL